VPEREHSQCSNKGEQTRKQHKHNFCRDARALQKAGHVKGREVRIVLCLLRHRCAQGAEGGEGEGDVLIIAHPKQCTPWKK